MWLQSNLLRRLAKGTREQGARTVQRFCDLRYVTTCATCAPATDRVHTRVRVFARAGVRTGEGDRPTEIKSTSGRARARARGETKVRVSVAAGKERRRRTRGRVTPECPRFLLSVPSLLSLARPVSLVLTRVPQSSPSLAGPSLCLFHLLALGGLLPIPGVHYLSFFSTSSVLPSYKWRAPSLVMSCPTVSCASDECSFR